MACNLVGYPYLEPDMFVPSLNLVWEVCGNS